LSEFNSEKYENLTTFTKVIVVKIKVVYLIRHSVVISQLIVQLLIKFSLFTYLYSVVCCSESCCEILVVAVPMALPDDNFLLINKH